MSESVTDPGSSSQQRDNTRQGLGKVVTASMAGGTTVEELVRSIVEPQVRTWLDQNLDSLLRDILRDKLNNVFR